MSDELTEALKVVLRHLSDLPKVPAPSITMPLVEWQAMVAENERLKARVQELARMPVAPRKMEWPDPKEISDRILGKGAKA